MGVPVEVQRIRQVHVDVPVPVEVQRIRQVPVDVPVAVQTQRIRQVPVQVQRPPVQQFVQQPVQTFTQPIQNFQPYSLAAPQATTFTTSTTNFPQTFTPPLNNNILYSGR